MTRRSVILAVRSADADTRRGALEALAASYWEIMLPGSFLGLIVGYATQRYGRSAAKTA